MEYVFIICILLAYKQNIKLQQFFSYEAWSSSSMLLVLILFSFNIYVWNWIQFSQNVVFPQCHAWPLTI